MSFSLEVFQRAKNALLPLVERQGIEGVGIGDQALRVYCWNADVAKQVPKQINGIPIEVVVTAGITAL